MRLFGRPRNRRAIPPTLADPGPAEAVATVNAEHGWKLLSLVNEWIRFADAKAGATLAFAGAMGTLLFNLVKNLTQTGCLLDVTVVATCVLLFAAVLLAGWAIAPRMKDKDVVPDTISRLFFASIAKTYKGKRVEYRDEVKRLTTDTESLVLELADQIHANAGIATTKTQRVTWAVRSALASGVLLAIVTIQVGLL
jgi:Family of unknown function (DUF5706)